jgi:acetylornithine deacetylase/succinyl-diaminopimelate desuccinylase-like protein
MLPRLTAELVELTRIPSISAPGHPVEPMYEACDLVTALLREAGVAVRTLKLPQTFPVVVGQIPAPPGAPTVLLYGHYDVVPAGDATTWTSPPFEPIERGGALYARGISDSKANILAHVGALRAWGGRPPVGITVVIEGQEEVGSALNTYPLERPELFAADAMVIGDMGSVRPGVPTLTVALRGMASVTVSVRTLAGPKHSGQYGGAAPDALIVLLHALAALHDAQGNVTVPGLRRKAWPGYSHSEEDFRALSETAPGLPFFGTGRLGERLWSGPALTVTGIDAPSVEQAVNAVQPWARATVNLRVHPEQDAAEAQRALLAFLRGLRPMGIPLEVTAGATGNGFAATTAGPAYTAARAALSAAWGGPTVLVGTGGSIPLVNALHRAQPEAEILLLGATDGFSNIHAPDERVLLDEFRNTVLAEADFFQQYAARWRA